MSNSELAAKMSGDSVKYQISGALVGEQKLSLSNITINIFENF